MNEEKTSRWTQWQERSGRPIGVREMSPADIVHFQMVLAQSYKCPVTDICYSFERIFDAHDEDRDDCVILIYKMSCIIKGKQEWRTVYKIKMPISADLRARGEEIMRNNHPALPAPSVPALKVRRPRRIAKDE